ncbi:MAG TPA: EAL domain-containing protein [Gammaproteobacteria bacterium]|nr:EAL domain-containing protein [Gammaproteobacteria bacterium]
MRSSTFYRLGLINNLCRAIPNNELMIHYQPKVEFPTGKMTHVEALMRWQPPRYGLGWCGWMNLCHWLSNPAAYANSTPG